MDIKVMRKSFKQEHHCYMCGEKIYKTVVILSALHGFVLCPTCSLELKDALEEFFINDEIVV